METVLFSPETTLRELVAARPTSARILERLQLDYCCGGKRSLRQACEEARLDPASVLERLAREAEGAADKEVDWSSQPLAALVEDIVTTHHAYLREELPRLAKVFARVLHRHGASHHELPRLQQAFTQLAAEMSSHMLKEEMVLFPAVCRLEQGVRSAGPCGGLGGPVSQMEAEHETAGRALREMRRLTSGYRAPDDACASFRGLYADLERLEADMHLHVHKENNILFPRAMALERGCAGLPLA